MRTPDNSHTSETLFRLFPRAWAPIGLAAAAIANLVWIGLLVYELAKLL
jgi:hypothetical protein